MTISKNLRFTFPIEVPDWARWVAIDYDGTCHIYKQMPVINEDANTWARGNKNLEQILFKLPDNYPDWRDSLKSILDTRDGFSVVEEV